MVRPSYSPSSYLLVMLWELKLFLITSHFYTFWWWIKIFGDWWHSRASFFLLSVQEGGENFLPGASYHFLISHWTTSIFDSLVSWPSAWRKLNKREAALIITCSEAEVDSINIKVKEEYGSVSYTLSCFPTPFRYEVNFAVRDPPWPHLEREVWDMSYQVIKVLKAWFEYIRLFLLFENKSTALVIWLQAFVIWRYPIYWRVERTTQTLPWQRKVAHLSVEIGHWVEYCQDVIKYQAELFCDGLRYISYEGYFEDLC